MDGLSLIYVNMVGKDYMDNYIYEFIFSDKTKGIDGEDWDSFPASGRPKAPYENFIKKVGRIESKLRLDVVQNSDSFSVWDSLDGIIALAWENIDDYETYPEKRLAFSFGETIKTVEEKLYEKDLILNYNKSKHEQPK